MQQPELGRQLTALRKEKNMTQDELAGKSHVSVRTIQRIEAGEVLPRMVTVRILLEALGENFESFSTKLQQHMKTEATTLPRPDKNALLIAAVAGIIYLVCEIILGALDISWFFEDRDWDLPMKAGYAGLTITMVTSFILFARGFVALSNVFENTLLKVVAYMLMAATVIIGATDIVSLSVRDFEDLWVPYVVLSVLFGALSIAFGLALIRLQDGMGELSRVAGILEFVLGFMLVTVFLFFLAYVVLIPTVVIEIILLYRGYEYLSRSERTQVAAA